MSKRQCHGNLALEVGMAHWQWMPGEIHVQDRLKCSVMALALGKAQARRWRQRGRAGTCSVMTLALGKAQARRWRQRGRAGFSGRCPRERGSASCQQEVAGAGGEPSALQDLIVFQVIILNCVAVKKWECWKLESLSRRHTLFMKR